MGLSTMIQDSKSVKSNRYSERSSRSRHGFYSVIRSTDCNSKRNQIRRSYRSRRVYIHSRSEKFEIYRNDYASSVELNIENQNGTVVYANGHTSYGKSYLASKVRVF